MSDSLMETLEATGQAQVIVSLKKQAATAASAKDLQRLFVPQEPALAASLALAAGGRSARRGAARPKAPAMRMYPHLGLALGILTLENHAALRADRRVADVVQAPELSLIRPVAKAAAAVTPQPTWGVKRLRAPELWQAGFTGQGVIVGHLDTGIDGKHAALRNAIHAYAEFNLAGDIVEGAEARDSDDHGTHTAGTIAGRKTATRAIGVAPGCTLASAMVIEGGDVVARILGGMDWVIGQGATILSMSLGLRGYTPAFQTVVNALRDANVLPVIAVGNEYPGTSRSPGNYVNVVSVGAIDKQDMVADFSSSQRFSRAVDPIVPDIVAPGVGVLSCVPGNHYMTMDGSSMATPHVAGLAALVKQAVPSATASDLEAAIFASCRRPANMDENRGNKGIPDAVAAFNHLGGALAASSSVPISLRGARRRARSPRG